MSAWFGAWRGRPVVLEQMRKAARRNLLRGDEVAEEEVADEEGDEEVGEEEVADVLLLLRGELERICVGGENVRRPGGDRGESRGRRPPAGR